MALRLTTRWLPGLLWILTLSAAATLLGLVLLAPVLAGREEAPEGWSRIVTLFARDAAVRRTALASVVGLVVTACVFFRPPRPLSGADRQSTSNSAGA